MATNGTFTIRADNNDNNGVLTLNWERTSFSVENRISTIYWELYCTLASNRSLAYNLNVADTNYKGTLTNTNYTNQLISVGIATIKHNNNGDALNFNITCNISVSGGNFFFGYDVTKSNSATFTLDLVPIPAVLIYAEDFTDETAAIPIQYTNYSGNAVGGLEACISFTGANDDVAYRPISKTETQYNFILTDAERATLRSGITQGDTATIRFYVRTKINGSYYYSSITKNINLVNYLPTIKPIITDKNGRANTLTGSTTKFIKYFSNAEVKINAQGQKGASIISRQIINGSQTINIEDREQDIAVIEGVDSNTFYFTTNDSRGYETKGFKVVDLVEYVKLTASLTLRPLTLAGDLTLVIEGNYFNGSFGAKSNTLEFEYGLRKNGGDISWTIIDTTKGTLELFNNSYRLTYTIRGLDPNSTYKITSNVIDELMSLQTEEQSVAAKPVFSWSKKDFKVNTPLYLSKNLSLRTIDNNGNDISVLNPCNPQGALVLGWGQYSNANGDTSIYGNNINLTANNNVNINGRTYGKNQVLWSGASHMNGSQTASLSQAISSQPNGIVLVFSLYRDGVAEDVSLNSFFVSKKEVELLPNAPHTFFMMINSGFSVIGAKYLYIDDRLITGHATNSLSGANNGINYANGSFVLRYVIGV